MSIDSRQQAAAHRSPPQHHHRHQVGKKKAQDDLFSTRQKLTIPCPSKSEDIDLTKEAREKMMGTVFTVIIHNSNNSQCSFLVLNNLNNSQYGTSIFIFPNNSRFPLLLSSPRSHIDHTRVPSTVAMADEVLLESAVRSFHVPYMTK